jgi:hypothetical protein
MKTTVWAVRNAETGERLSYRFRAKRDALEWAQGRDFMGLVLQVYRTTQDLPPHGKESRA